MIILMRIVNSRYFGIFFWKSTFLSGSACLQVVEITIETLYTAVKNTLTLITAPQATILWIFRSFSSFCALSRIRCYCGWYPPTTLPSWTIGLFHLYCCSPSLIHTQQETSSSFGIGAVIRNRRSGSCTGNQSSKSTCFIIISGCAKLWSIFPMTFRFGPKNNMTLKIPSLPRMFDGSRNRHLPKIQLIQLQRRCK